MERFWDKVEETDGFDPDVCSNALVESSGSMLEKEEVPAEVSEKTTAVDEALQLVTQLDLEYVNSALTNNKLYTQHGNWEEVLLY